MVALQLGWSLDRFWGATPAEFMFAMEAHRRNDHDMHRLVAWAAANLMQMWAKKGTRITVDGLLGTEEAAEPVPLTRAEFDAKMREKKAQREQRSPGGGR